MPRMALFIVIILGLLRIALAEENASGVVDKLVPVGEYLYANSEKTPAAEGSLRMQFAFPLAKGSVLIAYGRKNRKDRKSRDQSLEAERELYKPRLGKISPQQKEVVFSNLPPDFYDLILIDPENMMIYEGISLHKIGSDDALSEGVQKQYLDEIRSTLGLREDRIGGWEGFFDHKQIDRLEVNEDKAGVLMQQMRLGVALAESGERLKGTIHSIDLVWVERAKVASAGWQLLNRQQLYREELAAKTFFRHVFRKELQGIRIGSKEKVAGLLQLEK